MKTNLVNFELPKLKWFELKYQDLRKKSKEWTMLFAIILYLYQLPRLASSLPQARPTTALGIASGPTS